MSRDLLTCNSQQQGSHKHWENREKSANFEKNINSTIQETEESGFNEPQRKKKDCVISLSTASCPDTKLRVILSKQKCHFDVKTLFSQCIAKF